MLVQDTVRTSRALISQRRRGMSEEQVSKTFTALVLRGKLRQAVRFATERGEGGVLSASDIDAKSNRTVLESLRMKHPSPVLPAPEVLEPYDECPDFVTVDVTGETVMNVAWKLSGAGGPGGIDAAALSQWLLRFGEASQRLRCAVASLACWMANDFPPWAALRALMSNRLLALDKCPGVRPVGIGEIWRRLLAKCVLKVAGGEAKEACGNTQLCAGLEAGIEGAVHAARSLWEENEEEEEWGFLLVDAANAFNACNRIAAMWTVRHLWPSGARFSYNCYRHHALLVVRATDGHDGEWLVSKEGVTQGDPLSMVIYGLAMMPLATYLKSAVPNALQTWYADDAAAGGKFDELRVYFKLLLKYGPARGYFPEPAKSILVVPPPDGGSRPGCLL